MKSQPSHRTLGMSLALGAAMAITAMSYAQVTGDFNGDGFADLAVGIPDEDIRARVDAGAVAIIYGSADGLTAIDDQMWHQNRAGVPGTTDDDDRFGAALATGDFNNDGFDDLAIGSPGEAVGVDAGAGTVTVMFGSANGLTYLDSQLWHQDITGVTDGAERGDQFGASLSAGDFDGDGFADLAIGVPGESLGVDIEAGGVAILFGSASGITATGDQFFTQDTAGIQDGPESFDHFGETLATGDVNGDGRDDLAIGTPDEALNGRDDAGCVHALHGTPGGLTASASQMWTQDSPGIADKIEAGDGFGSALATGDFDDDGFDDLAVGVPEEDVGVIGDGGVVHVIYGRVQGLLASASQLWSQNSPDVPDQVEADDAFGAALAVGDFDDDGFDDLAIGVPGETIGGKAEAGAVIALFGGAARLSASGSQLRHQSSEGMQDRVDAGDEFGASVCAGDFDGDGAADLIVGVPGEDVSGNSNAGAAHAIYGAANGLRSGRDELWHQDSEYINDQAEGGDRFGGRDDV